MNYVLHYNNLIYKAKNRDSSILEYKENHHIVPKCLGGDNDKENLVFLTGREHFVAHLLLIKMYPDNNKLVYAAMRMTKQCNNGRYYEWLRKMHAENVSKQMKGNNFNLGRKRHLSERQAISKAMVGIPKSKSTKDKMSIAQLGNQKTKGLIRGKMSDEQKDKISKSKKGFRHTEESKRRISEKLKGVPKNGKRKKVIEP